jgi:hypothetical protein
VPAAAKEGEEMNDIVERLRGNWAHLGPDDAEEAADEIERLWEPLKIEVCKGRAGLALYVNNSRIAGPSHNGPMQAVLIGTYVPKEK